MTEKSKNSCLPSQAWLFLGTEIGEKDAAIKEIQKKLSAGEEARLGSAAPSGGELEETVFYAGDTDVPKMVSNMRNGSLFADKRLFIIKCAEGIKKKEDVDNFSSFLESIPDNTYLIFISEENSISKGIEKAIAPANRRVFWELSDSRKREWVEDFFRKEGFKIGRDGTETILELVENNTAALKQECSRLIVFLDKNTEITGETAEKWLSHTREESAFTLFSRIAAGDLS
ncbi:MAG: DNA polymerase III subunit delta, partial [Treponema sp.]|nr:DNA polymerase III subunit delta [Treponema sp.]